MDEIDEVNQVLEDMEIEEYYEHDDPHQYLTEFGEVDGTEAVTVLNNQSTLHVVTKMDIFNEPDNITSAFTFNNRYSDTTFQGIMPDSGAAGVSTAGKPQVLAF